MDERCRELIYSLLTIDYTKRIEWDEIFTNEWIYDNNINNNIIQKKHRDRHQ